MTKSEENQDKSIRNGYFKKLNLTEEEGGRGPSEEEAARD